MARGSVAALLLFLCLSAATFLSHAQDTDKLLTKVEKAENIQGDGKEVSDTVVSSVVDSAGPAELARWVVRSTIRRDCEILTHPVTRTTRSRM